MYKIERTYDVKKLVDRFNQQYTEITAGVGKVQGIKRPEIQLQNRKTFIPNFSQMCASMKREPADVSAYINKELQMQTSISAGGVLIIHAISRKTQVEKVIEKYVLEFVRCPLCKFQDTRIEKDNRITYLRCNRCHASTAI